MKKMVLKKDIIIKAGTVFTKAPSMTKRYGEGHIEGLVAMGEDNTISVDVFCNPDSPEEWSDWFVDWKDVK